MTYWWYVQQPKPMVEWILNTMVYKSPEIEYGLKHSPVQWVLDVIENNLGENEL